MCSHWNLLKCYLPKNLCIIWKISNQVSVLSSVNPNPILRSSNAELFSLWFWRTMKTDGCVLMSVSRMLTKCQLSCNGCVLGWESERECSLIQGCCNRETWTPEVTICHRFSLCLFHWIHNQNSDNKDCDIRFCPKMQVLTKLQMESEIRISCNEYAGVWFKTYLCYILALIVCTIFQCII